MNAKQKVLLTKSQIERLNLIDEMVKALFEHGKTLISEKAKKDNFEKSFELQQEKSEILNAGIQRQKDRDQKIESAAFKRGLEKALNAKPKTKSQKSGKPMTKAKKASFKHNLKSYNGLDIKSTLSGGSGFELGVDEDLTVEIFDTASRKFNGLLSDLVVTNGDSRLTRHLVHTVNSGSDTSTESDGTTAPQDNEVGTTPEFASMNYRLQTERFKTFVSDELDQDTDLTNDIKDQLAPAFSEAFGFSILNGSGDLVTKDGNFRGVIGSRLDLTAGTGESRKDDNTRSREVFQASFAGIDVSAISTEAEKISFSESVDDFLCSLPSKYHKNAKVYMPRNVYAFLKKLRNAEGQRYFPEVVNMKLGAYEVVLEDNIVTDLSGSEPLMVFGDVNSAMALKAIPAIVKENPYALDGAVVIDQKFRLLEAIKSNEALRVFANGN